MSRIGILPVEIPSGTTVTIENRKVTVTGAKGTLSYTHTPAVSVEQSEQQLVVKPKANDPNAASQFGLTRTLLANMTKGVSEGFERRLEINGVGYRASVSGRTLNLSLGYSHPIAYQLPEGVEAKVEANILTLSGADKQVVGQAAAEIRSKRKPEPYKGKGIRYSDEHVRRKAGKTATK